MRSSIGSAMDLSVCWCSSSSSSWVCSLLLVAVVVACQGSFLRGGFAQEWQEHLEGEVLELSGSNFDAAIANYQHILVDFYAPWCGHCKELAPELDEAAPRLSKNSPPITVAKLDAEKFSAISNKHKISAYPTLKLFINGIPTDYTGPRRADLIVSFLKRLVAPDVVVLDTHSALSEFMVHAGGNLPIIIGFGLEESTLSAIAIDIRQRAWFAVMRDPTEQIMEGYDFDKKPCLLVLQPKADERHVFYGPFEGSDFTEIIYQNLLPLVTQLTYESLRFVKEEGRPIALAILEDEESERSRNFLKKLKAMVPANRDFVFASVSLVGWPEFVDTFNVGKSTHVPILYIWNGKSDYYAIDEQAFTGDEVEFGILKLFHDFRANKAVQHKIKQPSLFERLVESIVHNILYIFIFIATIVLFLQNWDLGPSARRIRTANEDEDEDKEPLNSNFSETRTTDTSDDSKDE
ncbi:hypothetical protein O6H91_13G078800 [Diphasiastrum complanatum]|uniref:Uncharacterized protein n=1 Tax=Diphasiastrum complanatum TaxID=34168 RepID=A0ACC2BWA5_DIPCM|nr:hypothetical protein O6H91_13G078800 [Diphasiastrum complanatum]